MNKRKWRSGTGRRKNSLKINGIPQRLINLRASMSPIQFYLDELSCWSPRHEHAWTDGGLCPFHTGTCMDSFKVNLDSGGFRCFSCGASGSDIIAFYRMKYCLGFMDALRDLEERTGLWLR